MSAYPVSSFIPPPDRRRATDRVYINQRGVIITGRYFCSDDRRYPIADLAEITRERGTLHSGVTVGLVLAFIAAVAAVPLAVGVGTTGPISLAVVMVLIPAAVAVYCQHRWPASFELYANHHGDSVCLFSTRSELEFGQVARALIRACEATRQRV